MNAIGLGRDERRRKVLGVVLSAVATWVGVFGIYYLLPFEDVTSGQAVVRIAIGVVGFLVLLVWQVRRVRSSTTPGLRAVQALGGAVALFIFTFAVGYLSLSQASAGHFSEPLDHTGALYLTVTILATVGFGDITPKDDLARILVSVQMLLDLIVIGTVVRALATAARIGRTDPLTDAAG
jgi:voltage-gated potassium channel